MKKLNCPSCGETLEVESNNEYALCRKCKTRYNLKKDLNIKTKNEEEKLENEIQTPKQHQGISLVSVVLFIAIFMIIIATAFSMIQSKRTSQEEYNYHQVI